GAAERGEPQDGLLPDRYPQFLEDRPLPAGHYAPQPSPGQRDQGLVAFVNLRLVQPPTWDRCQVEPAGVDLPRLVSLGPVDAGQGDVAVFPESMVCPVLARQPRADLVRGQRLPNGREEILLAYPSYGSDQDVGGLQTLADVVGHLLG